MIPNHLNGNLSGQDGNSALDYLHMEEQEEQERETKGCLFWLSLVILTIVTISCILLTQLYDK